jgi:hypothetical protein
VKLRPAALALAAVMARSAPAAAQSNRPLFAALAALMGLDVRPPRRDDDEEPPPAPQGRVLLVRRRAAGAAHQMGFFWPATASLGGYFSSMIRCLIEIAVQITPAM